MSTNGHNGNGNGTQPIDRTQIIMEATYFCAVYGWYDTSEAAQKSNLLTVSMMDMANIPGEVLPAKATHRFFVSIDETSYFVTRYDGGHYEVQPHDQTEQQRRGRALREAVMDTALWYLTGEGAGYRPDPDLDVRAEERAAAIQELLEDVEADQRDGGPVIHAVVKQEQPDIFVAPGDADSPAPQALRQWRVSFGDDISCKIGFFGYDAEDGSPFLVAVESGEGDEDGTEGEEGNDAGVNVALADRIAIIKILFPESEGEELEKHLRDFQTILTSEENVQNREEAFRAYLASKEKEEKNQGGA